VAAPGAQRPIGPEDLLIGSKTVSIASEIIGTHFRYPDYYLVGREKIREFAKAIQMGSAALQRGGGRAAGHPDVVLLTFIAIAGRQVQLEHLPQFRRRHQPGPGDPPRPEDLYHRPRLATSCTSTRI
jgi:hypothetical protein